MLEYKNILFCTDFSEDANIAFLHALNLAQKYSASLHIIHVPHSPYTYEKHIVDQHVPAGKSQEGQAFYNKDIEMQAEKTLRETYEGRMGEFKDYRFVIKCGSPEIEIIRYAKENDIDLIVMGTLGTSAVSEVRGSTLAGVSQYAHCHVIAIRNPARQFTLPGKMV